MKIKEIKIVNQDESTEVADIGADAQNVDYNDTTVKAELDKLNNDINTNATNISSEIATRANAVTSLQSQINILASGSPKGVYATTTALINANPNTGVYIVTTDGHIYSWTKNAGSAVDLGIYQATGIGENRISMYNLDTYINNSIDSNFSNMENSIIEYGKYIETNGSERSASEDVYALISTTLRGGERLKYKVSMIGQNYGTSNQTAVYCLYDENNNVINRKTYQLVNGNNLFEEEIKIPENVRKIKINCSASKSNYLVNAMTYKQKQKIGYDELDDILKTKFTLLYNNELIPEEYIENAYINVTPTEGMELAAATGYNVYKVAIIPNKKYVIKNAIGFYSHISYGIGNNFIKELSVNNTSYNINSIGSYYRSDVTGNRVLLDDLYFTAPNFATYLYINTTDINENIFKVYEANIIDETTPFVRNDILYGKKYVACGDSFTHGDFTYSTDDINTYYDSTLQMYKTYPYWIGKRNNMTVINEAINGSIMALSKEYIEGTQDINYAHPFSYQRYQQIPNDADYITIMFGLNDMYHTNLGTITDITNETFYGAGNVILAYLIEHHPDARIGIIVSNAYLSNTYRQALRDLATKWGVGYLDLYNDINITKTLSGNGMSSEAINLKNSLYHVGNGNTHPNVRAHKIMSSAIEDFLRKL